MGLSRDRALRHRNLKSLHRGQESSPRGVVASGQPDARAIGVRGEIAPCRGEWSAKAPRVSVGSVNVNLRGRIRCGPASTKDPHLVVKDNRSSLTGYSWD